jgi:hypothetical protein
MKMDILLTVTPYHPDLNPIGLIWATVKRKVATRNTNFKINDTWKLAEEEFALITADQWKKRCRHVIDIEKAYMDNKQIVDVRTEELIINLTEDSSPRALSSNNRL